MKKLLLCCVALMAGCAVQGGGGVGLNVLETPAYLRSERWIPKNFVEIQRGVFKHRAACGSAIEFAVDPDHPSYARVSMPLGGAPGKDEAGWSRTLVLGLQLMSNMPTRGRIYSYYKPDDAQIQELYNAVLHPGICPGMPIPPEPEKPRD